MRGETHFHPQSRWMLRISFIQNAVDRYRNKPRSAASGAGRSYGALSVFFIGMLHGIGAETGTQVLLIAALGGAKEHGLGLGMLLSFLIGLLISNTSVALCATNGIAKSTRFRPVYLASSAVVAGFSLVIGSFFVFGASANLPDLQVALSRIDHSKVQ
jgi:high-affinity nickel-transport protein